MTAWKCGRIKNPSLGQGMEIVACEAVQRSDDCHRCLRTHRRLPRSPGTDGGSGQPRLRPLNCHPESAANPTSAASGKPTTRRTGIFNPHGASGGCPARLYPDVPVLAAPVVARHSRLEQRAGWWRAKKSSVRRRRRKRRTSNCRPRSGLASCPVSRVRCICPFQIVRAPINADGLGNLQRQSCIHLNGEPYPSDSWMGHSGRWGDTPWST